MSRQGMQMDGSQGRSGMGRNNSEASNAPSQYSSGSISHRERFEDERKRIEQSLFARLDEDGKPLEAYITHVRAIEDAVFPSAPPPQDHPTSPETKKSRVIIIAVRRSGRVRMHKARENTNGSFSIGKSWYLDDLISIENHSGTGFVVTIIKPYYWQTPTPREKDAFLATLIRVYKKYTGGREPKLVGFEGSYLGSGGGNNLTSPGTSAPVPGPAMGTVEANHSRLSPQKPSRPQQLNLQPQPLNSGPSVQPPPKSPLPSIPQNAGSPIPSPRPPLTPRGGGGGGGAPAGLGPPASNRNLQSSPSLDGGFNLGLNGSAQNLPPPTAPPDQVQRTIPPRKPMAHDSKPSMASLASSTGSLVSSESASLRRPSESSMDSRPGLVPEVEKPTPRNRTLSNEPGRPQLEPMKLGNLSQTSLTSEKSPSALSPPDMLGLPKKKSAKDVASQFRLAASAYAAGGALSALSSRSKSPHNAATSPPPPASPAARPLDTKPVAPIVSRTDDIPQDAARPDNLRPKAGAGPVNDESGGSIRLRSPTSSSLRDGIPEKSSRRSELPNMQGSQLEALKKFEVKQPQIQIQAETQPQTQNQGLAAAKSVGESAAPPLIKEPKGRREMSNKHDSLIFDNSEEQLSVVPQDVPEQLTEVKQKRRSMAAVTARNRFLSTVDTTNMTVDLNVLLDEFKWDGRTCKVGDLESKVKKELVKVESGNIWLSSSAGTDHVVRNKLMSELEQGFDEIIQQCEDLDGLMTLYAVELMSLSDDIAYIENQSQGLQVQTANQKTLQRELVALLETITISPQEIETLQGAKIQGDGLVQIENALAVLYKAMLTIDPTLGNHSSGGEDGVDESMQDGGMGKMVALRDKKDKYERDSKAFLGRFIEYMKIKYQQDLMLIGDTLDVRGSAKKAAAPPTVSQRSTKIESHMPAYASLYQFSAVIMFAKDVDRASYWQLLKYYQVPTRDLYQNQFRSQVAMWKRSIKKPTPEDQGILFTHTEKESESVAATVRAVTVKRSQTLARTLRSPLGDNPKEKANIDAGKLSSSEAFIIFLDEVMPLVVNEQNFLAEFFHMKAYGSAPTFLEFVHGGTSGKRQLDDLDRRRVPESDRNVARILNEAMTEIFSFLGNEFQSFIDAAIKSDPLQGVGILLALERKINLFKDTTNQEFIVRLLIKNIDQLRGMFIKFLKEQVRAIEATKVKIKKRKGVIDFMRIFPVFSTRIEDQLPSEQTAVENLDIREMVNNGYSIIHRAMMDTLQAIAKQSPQGTSQSMDPEDKEQLNYHIMMIENMNHYVEEVEIRSNSVLQDFKQRADEEYKEHMGLYMGAVIRRPLGKLLDFIEGVEAVENTLSPEEILQRPSHNKLAFKKILGQFDAKEMKEGIKTLGKRVEKHFSEGDDLNLSIKLVEKIMKALEAEYLKITNRVSNLLSGIYRDSGLDMGWRRDDITAAFTKTMSKQQ